MFNFSRFTRRYSKIIENVGYLGFVQIANFTVPLFAYPFLANKLSSKEFGYFVVTLSIINTFCILGDFGFGIYGTYKIASDQKNVDFINKFSSCLIFLKLFFIIPLFLIIFTMTFSDNFNQFKNVIFIGFLTVIFHTFQPLWYFQGKNEIKKFAIYMIFVKLVFISFLLVFDIFSTNSFNSILLWSISNLFGSIIAFIEMKKTGFKFTKVSFSYLFEILRESFEYFLSRAAVSLYTVGTTFIIGFFNLTDAAIFSIAEQLYRGAKSMLGTLAQGIYPVILPTKNFSLFKKVLIQGFFLLV